MSQKRCKTNAFVHNHMLFIENTDGSQYKVCDLQETSLRLVKMYLKELPEHWLRDKNLMRSIEEKTTLYFKEQVVKVFDDILIDY